MDRCLHQDEIPIVFYSAACTDLNWVQNRKFFCPDASHVWFLLPCTRLTPFFFIKHPISMYLNLTVQHRSFGLINFASLQGITGMCYDVTFVVVHFTTKLFCLFTSVFLQPESSILARQQDLSFFCLHMLMQFWNRLARSQQEMQSAWFPPESLCSFIESRTHSLNDGSSEVQFGARVGPHNSTSTA